MLHAATLNDNVKDYEGWYRAFPNVFYSEVLALKAQLESLPARIRGIEIGLGTKKFSQAMGIKEGVEPTREMLKLSERRSIEIMESFTGNPPNPTQFDFVMFENISHLQDLKSAIKQAYKLVKPGGAVIIGFLEKGKPIANLYQAKRQWNTFFKHANFYTVQYVEKLLHATGFNNLTYNQTLFGGLDDIDVIQAPKPGYDKGSFIVIKAIKI